MYEIDIPCLRRAVKESGYRQKYIADMCGINDRSFSRILKGTHGLPAYVYAGICKTLDVPMGTFVRQVNERDAKAPRSAG